MPALKTPCFFAFLLLNCDLLSADRDLLNLVNAFCKPLKYVFAPLNNVKTALNTKAED